MKIIARFEISYYQILNETSEIVGTLPSFAKDNEHLLRLYRIMVLNRVFDTKAIALQRTGRLGTYPSSLGQEAVFTGIGDAMLKNDILVPYYRDYAAMWMRGIPLSDILLFWGGDERGNLQGGEDLPFSVPVGSQGLHAAGIATALKIRQEKRAVLTTCGEGATSQGDFYEALNIAGIWKLPIVFVINNNQWAISVPRSQQTAAATLAQKAIAAGFQGEQVDGNDVLAVRERVDVALTKAREENIPTLLEMICYRQCDHTTADEATRYEPKGVRDLEWKKEPIMRLRRYLENLKIWNQILEEQLQKECTAEVEKAVQAYLATKPAPASDMIDYLYAKLPHTLFEQREQIKQVGDQCHG